MVYSKRRADIPAHDEVAPLTYSWPVTERRLKGGSLGAGHTSFRSNPNQRPCWQTMGMKISSTDGFMKKKLKETDDILKSEREVVGGPIKETLG